MSVLMIEPYLQAVVSNRGSDLHIRSGTKARVRVRGSLRELGTTDEHVLLHDQVEAMIAETMSVETRDKFNASNEADYAVSVPGVGRFRVNAFRGTGRAGLVARLVADEPASLAALGVPEVIGSLAMEPRGLVLVTGPTGQGKTTTLGAMVDRINESKAVHILTVEDPVEVMHRDKVAMVTQRELYTDTANFKVALKAAMRQDPDVILIGEMRDTDTVHAAVEAAMTGHFVMSTLHTTNAAETVNRIIDFFPPHEQKQIRLSLGQSLRGIVCQRLVPTADGQGRACVMEILVNTPRIAEAIMDPDKTANITTLVKEGAQYGMQTFDQHLVALVLARTVSIADAMGVASNPDDFALMLRRAGVSPQAIAAA